MAPQVRDPGETAGIASVVDALAGALGALDDGLASAWAVRDQTLAVARTTPEGREIATLLEAELLPVRARLDAVLVELSAHRRMLAGAYRAAVALEHREIPDAGRDLEILRARMAPYRRLGRTPIARPVVAPEARRPALPAYERPVPVDSGRVGGTDEADHQAGSANPFAFLLRGRSSAAPHAQAPAPPPSWPSHELEDARVGELEDVAPTGELEDVAPAGQLEDAPVGEVEDAPLTGRLGDAAVGELEDAAPAGQLEAATPVEAEGADTADGETAAVLASADGAAADASTTDADPAADDGATNPDDAATDPNDAATDPGDDDVSGGSGGPTAPADADGTPQVGEDELAAEHSEDPHEADVAAAAAAAAWHAADVASAAEEQRLQSRRRLRHRAGTIPVLVLLLLAVNTHGASLEAGPVAGSTRALAASPEPSQTVAAAVTTSAGDVTTVAGDAPTAADAPPAAGDDTAPGIAASQVIPSVTSATITSTATGSGAPARGRPDAVSTDRSSLLDAGIGSVVAHVFYRVSTTSPLIALTFDDGYNATALRQIVSILEQERVTATFFVNGMYLSRAPDVWRQIAADGFPVGNHTYHHTDVRTLTDSQIAADLARTESAWEALTGSPLAPIFRPPYGAHTAATDLAVADAGFPTIVLWDVTAGDTAKNPSRSQLIANATRGAAGSIVLMHAGPAITPSVLPDIIAWYRAHGYSFVTVPQLIAAGGS